MKICYFFLLVILLTLYTACPDPSGPGTNLTVIEVTDDIDAVTTWRAGNVYLIRTYDFYVNNTLSIEPGVIIKFHPSDGPYMMVGNGGTIVAAGTAEAPIIFTSYKDDTHGGDTNGDGTLTTPARKDWGAVNTNGYNGSRFEYCQFFYGGGDGATYTYTLTLEAGSVGTVKNCLFTDNDGSDSSGGYGVLDASTASAGTIITGNTFYNNIRPLSINTSFDLDDSNTFHNPADASQTNTYNGIFVYDGALKDNLVWQETEVAFVINDNDFGITTTLSLADDVVLKFRSDSALVLSAGIAGLVNYNGSGVYFTSYKDDTKKGDTNGDGSLTSPGAADWDGIYDNTNSIPDPFYFQWPNIFYDSY